MKIQVFQRGETVPIWAEDKNWAGVLIDPSAGIKVTLYQAKKKDGDPDVYAKDYNDTDINDKLMTWDAVGKYVFYYKSDIADPVGWWRYFCKAVDGTGDTARTVITHGGFKLQ